MINDLIWWRNFNDFTLMINDLIWWRNFNDFTLMINDLIWWRNSNDLKHTILAWKMASVAGTV